MIDLIKYLETLADKYPCPVADWLRSFREPGNMRCLKEDEPDEDWVVHGFLSDMFQIVTQFQRGFPDFQAAGVDYKHGVQLQKIQHITLLHGHTVGQIPQPFLADIAWG